MKFDSWRNFLLSSFPASSHGGWFTITAVSPLLPCSSCGEYSGLHNSCPEQGHHSISLLRCQLYEGYIVSIKDSYYRARIDNPCKYKRSQTPKELFSIMIFIAQVVVARCPTTVSTMKCKWCAYNYGRTCWPLNYRPPGECYSMFRSQFLLFTCVLGESYCWQMDFL